MLGVPLGATLLEGFEEMISYKAGYSYRDAGDGEWVFAQVLDWPNVITQGDDLDDARAMLADALALMNDSNCIG